MRVKEKSEKAGLKLNIQKTKIMVSSPIISWQIDGEKWKQWQILFSGSKITVVCYCSHEIKRHLFLGRKVMTDLGSVLKSRDITLPTMICIVKAMVFPVVMYRCGCWTIKKTEHWRIFELWLWIRLLRVRCTARISNQSILKEINSDYSLEGLRRESWDSSTLTTYCEELTHWKWPLLWGRLKANEEGGGRGWNGWIASPTQSTWIWANSER